MSIQRTAIWAFVWAALALLSEPVWAQPANSNLNYQTPTPSWENGSAPFAEDNPHQDHDFLPFHPMNFEPTGEPFAPAETSGYGNGPHPHIGYWFSYERVFWSLSKPALGFVGSQNAPLPLANVFAFFRQPPFVFPDGPTADNSFIGATGAWGNRFELGYIDDENNGWMVSILDHVRQAQYELKHNPAISFNDPNGLLHLFSGIPFPVGPGRFFTDLGELPTLFSSVTLKNVLEINGVELMRTYRASRLHNGGYFELLYGPRWLQINDTFIVQGNGNGLASETFGFTLNNVSNAFTFPLNILDGSTWSTRANNSIIGPQIGGRWFHQRGRWITSFEARFMAGANFQNVTQKTSLGDQVVLNGLISGSTTQIIQFRGLGSDTHQFTTTFSPVGEIRAQTVFEVTKNVGIKIGYTGLVVGNISRASNRVDYSGPNLISILNGGTHQSFFSNGINMGVEINR